MPFGETPPGFPATGEGKVSKLRPFFSQPFLRAAALVVGMALMATGVWSVPAHAQFSDSYKFLEAVRKKEGDVVTDKLSEPGTTIINTRDITSGQTALHIVTARRDITWMSFLIGKGANVNIRDAKGVTPLVLATNLGFLEGVDLLIEQKAHVDESNNAGETPLITAVHNRNIGLMRILLKAGANPDRADNSGRSARDYALLEGRSNPLINEIQNNAKIKDANSRARPSYGPSL